MIHWMAANITSNELLEDAGRNGPDFVQGVNSWICIQGGGHSGEMCGRYGGMAPPEGHGTHVYEIKVCALDTMLDLKDGFHLNQMYHGMEGHILDQLQGAGIFFPDYHMAHLPL